MVIPAVVGEAERRWIRELLLLDEVPPPELDGIEAELVGEDVHRALDRVAGLGDPEGTPVGDAARRLVGEVRVHFRVRHRDVVTAGHHAEHAGRILRGIGGRIERAVVGGRRDAKRRQSAVRAGAELDIHVIVARESRRREVFRPRLDPLDRAPEFQRADDRADVARVHRHLVAKAAADVRRDDVDLVFRNAGHQRERGPVDVRRLGRDVELQASHRVEVRHAAAGLERSRDGSAETRCAG